MNFYVIKEYFHSAVFDDKNAAEQFKINIESEAKVMEFVSLAKVWKYLNWEVNNTEVFIKETDSYAAIYENKIDANSGMKFNGPYQASTYLNWEKTNMLGERNGLGKSKIYKHLLEYTYNKCDYLLKYNQEDNVTLVTTIFYFLYVIAVIIAIGVYTYQKRNIPNCFEAFIWIGLIVVLAVFLYRYFRTFFSTKKSSSLISKKNGAIKQISNEVYWEINKYCLSKESLEELIKETYEVNEKPEINKSGLGQTVKTIGTAIVSFIVPRLVEILFTEQNLYKVTNQIDYKIVTVVFFSISVIIIMCGLIFVIKEMRYATKLYYRKNHEVSSLLLRQELKNILLERI